MASSTRSSLDNVITPDSLYGTDIRSVHSEPAHNGDVDYAILGGSAAVRDSLSERTVRVNRLDRRHRSRSEIFWTPRIFDL